MRRVWAPPDDVNSCATGISDTLPPAVIPSRTPLRAPGKLPHAFLHFRAEKTPTPLRTASLQASIPPASACFRPGAMANSGQMGGYAVNSPPDTSGCRPRRPLSPTPPDHSFLRGTIFPLPEVFSLYALSNAQTHSIFPAVRQGSHSQINELLRQSAYPGQLSPPLFEDLYQHSILYRLF